MAVSKLTKVTAIASIITLLAGTTAVFVSRNGEIQDRIAKLFNIADGYKDELDAKVKMLRELASSLGVENFNELTYEELIEAIRDKVNSNEGSVMNKDTQMTYNQIAKKLGLPESDNGMIINYTKAQILDELDNLMTEIEKLEKLVEVDSEGNIPLKEKLEKMIADIGLANKEEEEQLKALNGKIIALGHCPKDNGELIDNVCQTCGTIYDSETAPVDPVDPPAISNPTDKTPTENQPTEDTSQDQVDPPAISNPTDKTPTENQPVDETPADTTVLTRAQMKQSLMDCGLSSDQAEAIFRDLESDYFADKMTKNENSGDYKVNSKWVAYKASTYVWKFGSDTSISGVYVTESALDQLMAYHNARFE